MRSKSFCSPLPIGLSTFRLIICFDFSCRVFVILMKNVLESMEECGGEYSGNLHCYGGLVMVRLPWCGQSVESPLG